jgi:signal transduction histidine kinase
MTPWLSAQYKVTFIVKEKTAIHHDSIYVTGTFSNWDSTPNKNYLMHPIANNEKSITLNLPEGSIRYKFHRGNWFTVEKQYNGDEVPDRIVTIKSDAVFVDNIYSWRDELLIDKKYALRQTTEDSNRIQIMAAIASNYAFWPEYYNLDSALHYANEALQLQQSIDKSGEYQSWKTNDQSLMQIGMQEVIATLLHSLGNYPKSLEIRLENLNMAEKVKDKYIMADAINAIQQDYNSMNDFGNVLRYGKMMDSILSAVDTTDNRFKSAEKNAKYIIANAYYKLNQPDSALFYANISSRISTARTLGDTAFIHPLLGDIYSQMGNDAAAFYHYRLALPKAFQIHNPQLAASNLEGIAKLFKKEGHIDSALYYAKLALNLLQNNKITVQSWGENSNTYLAEISPLIAELYKENGQPDSAYKYLLLSVTLKDSLYNTNKVRQFQTLSFNEAARRQQLEQQAAEAKKKYQTRIKIYGLISVITGFIILAIILYRNNKNKQKANAILQRQKNEIENTLWELRNTQQQLIQSEKMASLGELTAGIAHEIQNPLNFVNNFSEVNMEMIEELKKELTTGNLQSANEIADDLSSNEEKINHHGKRADAIVKGMLQHSRKSSGHKEPTDINALADEYLRLSYHGLRAKDKNFNATIETDFDNTIGKINIIPQDIGRVLLNLFNNAFYAVNEQKNRNPDLYEPTVSVSTKKS